MIELTISIDPQLIYLKERHTKLAIWYKEIIEKDYSTFIMYQLLSLKSTEDIRRTCFYRIRDLYEKMKQPTWIPEKEPSPLGYTSRGFELLDGNKRVNISLAMGWPVFVTYPWEHNYNK